MKVKFLKCVACSVLDKVFNCNVEYEIDSVRAKDFINSGVAIEITEVKKQVRQKRVKKTQENQG